MIISHKHKFIFFAIPKTGTHAVRFALRPYFGAEDEEHVSLFHQSRLNIPAFKNRENGHFRPDEIKSFISPEIWNTYFKFCFIRNPFDRFVSAVFFKNSIIQLQPQLANDYLNKMIDKDPAEFGLHYQPQIPFLVDDQNEIVMDFIGRTENMQSDFDFICTKIGLPKITLERKNISKHEYYKQYYTSELKEKVGKVYKEDIERLNYTF